MAREKQPSIDDLSADRPPKREGSSDSYPVFSDDQAKHIYTILKDQNETLEKQDVKLAEIDAQGKKQDETLEEISKNVLKVVDRDADQEKTLGELKEFKAQVLKESASKAGKWSVFGTVLGVIIASAATTVMQQCRWVTPGSTQTQQTPTPK